MDIFDAAMHPEVELNDLPEIDNLTAIHTWEGVDTDGVTFHVYTVGGTLNGKPIERADHIRKQVFGALPGGDAMIIHGKDRKEADALAIEGLADTVNYVISLRESVGVEPGANAGIITEGQRVDPVGH